MSRKISNDKITTEIEIRTDKTREKIHELSKEIDRCKESNRACNAEIAKLRVFSIFERFVLITYDFYCGVHIFIILRLG